MVVIMENRKIKSNRAQADYFELLVCKYICDKYHLKFNYMETLNNLPQKILSLPNGKERLQLQEKNLNRLSPELDKILDFEISKKGKIIEVRWVGRKVIIKTTSDIDVKHISDNFTKFSVKSIWKSGLGTIKNLGMKSIMKFYGIDFRKEYETMWKELRDYLKTPLDSESEIKKIVLKDKKLKDWAFKNGQKYQIKLNELCYNSFNQLPQEKKVEFLDFVLDRKDPNLYVIIVNEKGVIVYKPYQIKLSQQQKIEAKYKTDTGYTIYIDNIPSYRVQTNATNGIGISPFCQRIFFATGK